MKDQKFKPTAFMSYVRSDDSDKRISKLRELLTEAVRRNTGFETFEIFQDVIHIRWGEDWEDKLKKSINEVIFFIPILTPRFFKSKYCICELRAFLDREKELNRKDLTLPIYYRNDPKFDSNTREDELAFKLKKRAFIDWRDLKNVPIEAQNFSSRDEYSKVQERLDSLAIQIREALERVENEGELAENNDSNIKALYSSNNKKLLEQYLGKDYISQCERHNGNTIIKNNITLGQLKTIYENIFRATDESYYVSSIYPPSHWIRGHLLLNWGEFTDKRNDPKEKGKELVKFFKQIMKIGHPIDESKIRYEFPNEYIVKVISEETDKEHFCIILRNEYAILRSDNLRNKKRNKNRKEIKLLRNEGGDIYSGLLDELDYIKYFFKKIRDLRDNIKKIRVHITDVHACEDVWREEPKDVIKEYFALNEGIEQRVCSLGEDDVLIRYYGDVILIDKIIALLYEPNLAEPFGEIDGQIQIITGDLVNQLLKIFEDKEMEHCSEPANKFWEKQLYD